MSDDDFILERWDQTEPNMQRQIVLAFATENALLRAVADAAASDNPAWHSECHCMKCKRVRTALAKLREWREKP